MTMWQTVAMYVGVRRCSSVVACGALLLAAGVARPSVARADTSIWTRISLPTDKENPDGPADQSDDRVTGIYFKDLDHGLIVANTATASRVGIILSATATKVTGVAFRGAHHAADGQQDTSFRGYNPTADGGLVFLTAPFGDQIIRCDRDLHFTRGPLGHGDVANPPFLLRETAGGKWWIMNQLGVCTADDAPSQGTEWTAIWEPEHHVPDPIPAGFCTEAPADSLSVDGSINARAYVSPDGEMIAYPLSHAASLCVCRDGGKTWKEVPLPDAPKAAPGEVGSGLGPSQVTFSDKVHGWACSEGGGKPYVYATTDGGQTWTAGKFPDKVMAHAGESGFMFRAMFFAPDNKTGWIVGRSGTDNRPLLLRTKDGGATWKDRATGPNSLVIVIPPDGEELMSGFALDADHVWVGGKTGAVYYTDKASQ